MREGKRETYPPQLIVEEDISDLLLLSTRHLLQVSH